MKINFRALLIAAGVTTLIILCIMLAWFLLPILFILGVFFIIYVLMTMENPDVARSNSNAATEIDQKSTSQANPETPE
ncbi:MAG: hypothetical protein GY829_11050 [Gammaproteobacteria bacterium]|nr:hypothetical protein [Gammaproteobacteria bacterium]